MELPLSTRDGCQDVSVGSFCQPW